ncbi:hypothetical protein QJS04_geneDACA022027 [Acorus gramineus]|uniref:Uncharacterized protein n=1 Tax=Acorus gramineus TaxID=55184 RepID=A0AAV9AF85_ACOGR|nr:hypothetical protein QJS04_geneDACA022027 [Acorus gramineus]
MEIDGKAFAGKGTKASIQRNLRRSLSSMARMENHLPGISRSMRNSGSWRRSSLSLPRSVFPDSATEDAWIARSGDSGRMPYEDDYSEGLAEMDYPESVESETVTSDARIYPDSMQPVLESMSPLPTHEMIHPIVTKPHKDKVDKLDRYINFLFRYLSLALFGVFGVLTRHLLQKLFGPGVIGFTSDKTPIYLDLPSNMVGSFFMGWFGVIFKGDVRHISEHLAIAITTGYLGSLTTFSGWNQKMLDLCAKGSWVFAVLGYLIGMFLMNQSIIVGVNTAEGLRRILLKKPDDHSNPNVLISWRIHSRGQRLVALALILMFLGPLYGVSGKLVREQMHNNDAGARLWLGCLVGAPGVWIRFLLADLNGKGLGRKGHLRWLPVGTLCANVLAASLMAALSTVNKEVNTKRCGIIVTGIQFGFLGSLSTVSTFAAEVYNLNQSGHPWRAFAYGATTIILSFVVGILIYLIPTWTRNYH